MRLSEIYTSVQGEGPDVGLLTQFVRFAGCNLRCPGWPCDTQHAIDPEKYRHEWEKVEPQEVALRIRESDVSHITLTGGEPFLQPEPELTALVRQYLPVHFRFNIFTNGTLPFPSWAQSSSIRIIMDWKLPGSGEGDINLATRMRNLGWLTNKDAVKFVCTDYDDFTTALHIIIDNPELLSRPHLYVGAAWGRVKEAEVVEWMKEHSDFKYPLKLNVQTHNYVWNRKERGI